MSVPAPGHFRGVSEHGVHRLSRARPDPELLETRTPANRAPGMRALMLRVPVPM